MEHITSKIQNLGDLELAILLSLVAEQHCILTTNKQMLDSLAQELFIISTKVFNLSCALINCSASTTLDEFRESVLVDNSDPDGDAADNLTPYLSPLSSQLLSPRQSMVHKGSGYSNSLDERKVANIIIAKDLNLASHNVQTQALELIRTRRLFSHTAMHAASKDFLFIALQASGSVGLTLHLNDLFAISHYHLPEDGFPHLEESAVGTAMFDDTASTSSVIKTTPERPTNFSDTPVVLKTDIQKLRSAAARAQMDAGVATYLHNVAVFLRLSRYVAGGVTAISTMHFRTIVRALAPLHDLTYCPPSLVALATRKVYPHRLVLATAKTERSLQWGSDPAAVQDAMKGITVEDAIEDTLSSVEAPL